MRKFPDNIVWWAQNPGELVRRIAGKIYRRIHPHEPWISLDAIKFCQKELPPSTIAIEWGSGRSTVWFAKILKRITSVEDNKDWHGYVQNRLNELNLKNVDYRFVPLNHPINEPTKPTYEKLPDYVAVANDFENESVDFIVVDGHYRQACIQAGMPKLKRGGLLLVDNSNWMPRPEWGVPSNWPVVHCSRGFDGETTIWRKP
jgi:hypothetical protein